MSILEDLHTLKEKNFWSSIANTNIEYIKSSIAQWQEEQKYTNTLLKFFYEITGFNYTEKEICFHSQDLKDSLSSQDCIVLFKNIDKIENDYIKVLILGFFWKYKKLQPQKENFNAVSLSLTIYLGIVDILFQEFKKSHDTIIEMYLVKILTYCLYISVAIRSSLYDEFISKARFFSDLEYTTDTSYLIRSSIDLLIKHSDLTTINLCLEKLEKLLQKINEDYIQQEAILDIAISSTKKLKNKTKTEELLIRKAEMFITQARKENDIHREVYLLKRASSIYINLPTCKERWKSLCQEIEQKSPRLLDTLATIQFEYKPNIDYINRSIQSVTNKSFKNCLKELAKCIDILPFEDQIEEIRCKKGILSDLFASTILDEKGFTTAIITDKNKHPMSFYSALNFYWFSMCIHNINPILHQINQEHFFTYQDLIPLCTHNPFIPEERIEIFAKGLYYFLKQDIIVCSNLLIPQLENSFRHILYGLELITKSQKDGKQEYKIDMQWLLNTLLKKGLIGKKIFFNLKMLLCDDSFNLRNEIAHGLLSDSRFNNANVMILNWCIFFFVFAYLIREEKGNME